MKKIIILLFLLIPYSQVISQDFIRKNTYAGDSLFDFIHSWWGTKYKYGGTTRTGIDCSAFTLKLFDDVYDAVLPRTALEQYRATKRIPKEDLKDGDLVFFRTRYKSTWHVGVYLTDGWFVHSKSKVGISIDNLGNPLYNKIYYGAGRLEK